jgi:hypothetical protein
MSTGVSAAKRGAVATNRYVPGRSPSKRYTPVESELAHVAALAICVAQPEQYAQTVAVVIARPNGVVTAPLIEHSRCAS